MIRYLFFLLGVTAFSWSAAQSVPNGDFENWIGTANENPLYYPLVSNASAQTLGLPSNVVKVADPHDGNFAVQVKTVGNANDTAFGYIINGDPNTGAGGIPYNEHPITLSGYYKSILPSDTAILFIAFKENGVILSTNYAYFYGIHTNYTYFYIPLTIPALANPDSLVFGLISCNPSVPNPTPNSWIQLDHLLFNGVPTQPPQMNGSFENWTGETSWQISQWETVGDTAVRSTSPHSGLLALQLTTVMYDAFTAGPSIATTGHFYQNNIIAGRPYSQMNDTLCGWYKYTVNGIDSAAGGAIAMQSGTPVGYAIASFPAASNYTYFELPLTCAQQPDTLILLFVSSADNTVPANAGSRFYLDGLFLKSSPLSVSEYDWSAWGLVTLYPNPVLSGENAWLEFSSNSASSLISVYDASGKLISEERVSANGKFRYEIESSGFTPGMYTVVLMQDGKRAVRKMIVQ